MASCEQEESFDDFVDLDKDLDLDLDLDLNLDMDVSEDFGIEIVGGNSAEIIIFDNESEVSPLMKCMLCRRGMEWSRRSCRLPAVNTYRCGKLSGCASKS